MFVCAYVVEHAGSEGPIERCVREWKAHTVEGHEVRTSAKPAHADLEASERHVDAGERRVWKVLAKVRDRCSDARAEVQKMTAGIATNIHADQTLQVLDLVLGEVLRRLTRRSDIRLMKRSVLVSEPVEFRSIHRGGSCSFSVVSPRRASSMVTSREGPY